MNNIRLSVIFGVIGALEGILFWVILLNQPEKDVIIAFIFWGFIPALFAISSHYFKKTFLMLLATLIALPIGLYLLIGANNYFRLFGSIPGLYLISFIFMLREVKNKEAYKVKFYRNGFLIK